jgi:hypothetical protein
MSFDGVDDYVDLGDNTVFDFTDDFTLCGFYKTIMAVTGTVVSKYTTGASGYRIAVRPDVSNQPIQITVGDGTTSASLSATTRAVDDVWHFFAGGRLGSTVFLTTEVETRTTSYTGGAMDSRGKRFLIGRREGSNPSWFRGLVSQILAYNRALLLPERNHNLNNPFRPVKNGLVLALIAHPDYIRDIDNDGVLEWIDLSGLANHGKIYGARLVTFNTPVRILPKVRTLPVAR